MAHDATFKKAIEEYKEYKQILEESWPERIPTMKERKIRVNPKLEKMDVWSFFAKARHCLPVHFGISPSNSFSPRASSQFASSHNQMARRILP